MKWGNRGGCVLLVLLLIFSFWLVLEEGDAMSGIGLPDWGRIKKGAGVSPLADLGELAARLGSIDTFDRRGDTVWMDDFEDGIQKWAAESGGTGAEVTSSALRARNGGYCARLVAGSDGTRYAQLSRSVPYRVPSRVGLEYSFTLDSNIEYIELDLLWLSTTVQLRGLIRYTRADKTLHYRDSTGTLVLLASNISLSTYAWSFNTWKLVIDPDTKSYTRLIMGGVEYDLTGYRLAESAITGWHSINTIIFVRGNAGANGVVQVDDVIIKQNEP